MPNYTQCENVKHCYLVPFACSVYSEVTGVCHHSHTRVCKYTVYCIVCAKLMSFIVIELKQH